MENSQPTDLVSVDESKLIKIIEKYIKQTAPNAPKYVVDDFIALCIHFNLNPLLREVFLIPYKNTKTGETTYSTVTGFTAYIARAEATGLLDSYKVYTELKRKLKVNSKTEQFEDISDLCATVEIYKKGSVRPIVRSFFYSEFAVKAYDKNAGKPMLSKFWREKPVYMLEKVALSRALSAAFPRQLGGMPYDDAELGMSEVREIIDTETDTMESILQGFARCSTLEQLKEYGAQIKGLVLSDSARAQLKEAYISRCHSIIAEQAQQQATTSELQQEEAETPLDQKPIGQRYAVAINAINEATSIQELNQVLDMFEQKLSSSEYNSLSSWISDKRADLSSHDYNKNKDLPDEELVF